MELPLKMLLKILECRRTTLCQWCPLLLIVNIRKISEPFFTIRNSTDYLEYTLSLILSFGMSSKTIIKVLMSETFHILHVSYPARLQDKKALTYSQEKTISMPDFLTYYYLFPVAIIIAVLAMSAGISGTNFWIPVYIIWLGFDTKTAFWLGLLTMIFGFGSGMLKNLRQKTVNWHIVKEYLKIAIPAAMFGSLLVPFAPVGILLLLFASFILGYGIYLIYRYWLYRRGKVPEKLVYHDHICWKRAAIAGFLERLIATGLGKLITPCILEHRDIKSPAEAVGSVVPIIFVVTLIAFLFRLTPDFIPFLVEQKVLIFDTMLWVAPGVFLGGQLGPGCCKKILAAGDEALCGSYAGQCQHADISKGL